MKIQEIVKLLAEHCKGGCSDECYYMDVPTVECKLINHIADKLDLSDVDKVEPGRESDGEDNDEDNYPFGHEVSR